MAKSTHANVIRFAEYEGISVNAFINMAINEKIGGVTCLAEIEKMYKRKRQENHSKHKVSVPITKIL